MDSLKLPLVGFIVLLLVGCKVAMHEGGELVNSPYTVVEQDGKSLWLIYRDSLGNNYEDASGIHKIKYSSFRFLRRRKQITEFYNLKGYYPDSTALEEYAIGIEVLKNGKLIDLQFRDSNNQLMQPSYYNYARIKFKYFRDNSWRESYFDANNKPTCFDDCTQQRLAWDTIWPANKADTNYFICTKLLDYEKCKTEPE